MNKDMSYKICPMFKTIEKKYLPRANIKWLFVVTLSDWFDSLFLSFVAGIAYGLGCSSGFLVSLQDVLRFFRGTTTEC